MYAFMQINMNIEIANTTVHKIKQTFVSRLRRKNWKLQKHFPFMAFLMVCVISLKFIRKFYRCCLFGNIIFF